MRPRPSTARRCQSCPGAPEQQHRLGHRGRVHQLCRAGSLVRCPRAYAGGTKHPVQSCCHAPGTVHCVRCAGRCARRAGGRQGGRRPPTGRQQAAPCARHSQAVVGACMHQADSEYTHWHGVADRGGYGGNRGGRACVSALCDAGRPQVPPGAGPGAGRGGRAGRGALPAALGAGDDRGGRRHELAGLPEHGGAADAGASPGPARGVRAGLGLMRGPCCGPARCWSRGAGMLCAVHLGLTGHLKAAMTVSGPFQCI